MKKIIQLTAIMLIVCSSVSFSETVSRVFSYNGPGNQLDFCTGIVQDNEGRVYATGVSWGSNNTKEDYATIKFGEDGDFIWVARYDGPGHNLDYASAIAIDNAGNVYVTGWSRSGSSYGTEDYLTIKYNNNGVMLWSRRYDGSLGNDCHSYDYAKAIYVDAAGNVYVTGQSWGNDDLRDDYLTVKYNSNGALQWAKRYNGPSCKEDIASSLAVDPNGNVYVTGKSFQSNKGYDIVTVKYNGSGSQQWAARYNGTNNSDDGGNEVKVDDNGNVYVTGFTHAGTQKLNYATLKYNTAGAQQWLKTFSNPNRNDTDVATGLDLDVYGNVYVTGYSKGYTEPTNVVSYDYVTVKYANFDGAQMWMNIYDGGSDDKAFDIKVVNKGCSSGPRTSGDVPCWDIDVYVTGQSTGIGTQGDIVTARYLENGTSKWVNRFNGPTNGNDGAFSISVKNNHPIIYTAGAFGNDYGIIGITESRSTAMDNITGMSTSYPNPFNPETNISFRVEKEGAVKIVIFDILGRTVATLLDKKMGAGVHSVNWNASNLNSGVYFYRLDTEYASETKKLVLVK
jgi:hypothetical protein